ncbi:ribonuclease H-like domain-containing protein [Tanacetum coccineum]
MKDEYNALIKINTWTLVPRPAEANIVHCMCLFHHKYLADVTLSRYKDRLVANGSTQLAGADVDETFSPVVKPSTIRTFLSLAISRHWHVHQLDVKNAFLHGDLSETIYMHQPPGFSHSRCDSSLFIYLHGTDTAYLLLYVDDIVLTASFEILLQRIIASLHQEFSMKEMSSLNYFLVISVTRDSSGMFLSQRNDPVSDPTLYWSLAGSLQYLTFTRPKISYAEQQVCLYMHDPRKRHFSALKRILRLVALLLGDRRQVEYHGVANVVIETCWLKNLLRELHTHLSSSTLVYYDNASVVYLSYNPITYEAYRD